MNDQPITTVLPIAKKKLGRTVSVHTAVGLMWNVYASESLWVLKDWKKKLMRMLVYVTLCSISPPAIPSGPDAKAGYTLIVSRISTCLCTISWTISWDCEPITIHFSQYRRFRSSLILRETWQETFPISYLANYTLIVKLTRMWKNVGEMRDGIS